MNDPEEDTMTSPSTEMNGCAPSRSQSLAGTGGKGPRRSRPDSVPAKLALGAIALACVVGGWSATAGAGSTKDVTLVTRSGSVRVIPAPIGYAVDTQSGVTNGPISQSSFDAEVGSGSSTSFGFVKGYDITYLSTATNESVEVTVFAFHSKAGAAAFTKAAMTFWGASGLAPTNRTVRAVPGSTVQIATKAGSDSFYLVDAFARKGDYTLAVEDANTTKPNGVPEQLKAAFISQYARL